MYSSLESKATYLHLDKEGKLQWSTEMDTTRLSSLALLQFYRVGNLPSIEVVYHYYMDGQLIESRNATQAIGSDYNAPGLGNDLLAYEYENNRPVGKDNRVVKVIVKERLPFVKSTDTQQAHWYFMTIGKDGQWTKKGVVDDGDGKRIVMSNRPFSLADTDDQWCFVGNVIEGFRIYNRKDQRKLVTTTDMKSGSNGNTNNGGANYIYCKPHDYQPNVALKETDLWHVLPSSYMDNGFFLAVETAKGLMCANNRNNVLAFWTGGADAGSTFTLTQEIPSVTLSTAGNYSYGSLFFPFDTEIEKDVTAYTLVQLPTQEVEGATATMKAIEGYIVPAYTGVILRADKSKRQARLRIALPSGTPSDKGMLEGTLRTKTIPSGDKQHYWVLTEKDGEMVLANPVTTTFKANTAFLHLSNNTNTIFHLSFDTTSGIENMFLPPGKDDVYDMSGRRLLPQVKPLPKGIYIIGGKKVIVK